MQIAIHWLSLPSFVFPSPVSYCFFVIRRINVCWHFNLQPNICTEYSLIQGNWFSITFTMCELRSVAYIAYRHEFDCFILPLVFIQGVSVKDLKDDTITETMVPSRSQIPNWSMTPSFQQIGLTQSTVWYVGHKIRNLTWCSLVWKYGGLIKALEIFLITSSYESMKTIIWLYPPKIIAEGIPPIAIWRKLPLLVES